MSILRRVDEEWRRLDPPPDDNHGYFASVLNKLTPDELKEWRRQCLIVEGMQPQYGSYEKALDAFEAMNRGLRSGRLPRDIPHPG